MNKNLDLILLGPKRKPKTKASGLNRPPGIPKELTEKYAGKDFELSFPGFSYVKDLGFYVSDTVSLKGETWEDTKQILEDKGVFSLTPEQFLVYRQFCIAENPDLLRASISQEGSDEWLDACVVDRKKLYVSPTSSQLEKNLKGVRSKKVSAIRAPGYFSGIPSDGYPAKLSKTGDIRFLPPTISDGKPVVCLKAKMMSGLTVSYEHRVDYDDEDIGVRVCFNLSEYAAARDLVD